jgi:hypothetical protein
MQILISTCDANCRIPDQDVAVFQDAPAAPPLHQLGTRSWPGGAGLLEADAWVQEASGDRRREASSREWPAGEGSRR